MRKFYVLLTIVGIFAPMVFFVPWVMAHGLDIQKLLAEIAASKISAFAWMDVMVSAIALIGFILYERRTLNVPFFGLAIAATLMIGVSAGLPLYLALRLNALKTTNAA